jgi:hypothetical protein
MLLEVLPSRHEKLPLKEYLLLRTASIKVFLTRPGYSERRPYGDNDCNSAGSSFDAVQLQDDAVKSNMVFLGKSAHDFFSITGKHNVPVFKDGFKMDVFSPKLINIG